MALSRNLSAPQSPHTGEASPQYGPEAPKQLWKVGGPLEEPRSRLLGTQKSSFDFGMYTTAVGTVNCSVARELDLSARVEGAFSYISAQRPRGCSVATRRAVGIKSSGDTTRPGSRYRHVPTANQCALDDLGSSSTPATTWNGALGEADIAEKHRMMSPPHCIRSLGKAPVAHAIWGFGQRPQRHGEASTHRGEHLIVRIRRLSLHNHRGYPVAQILAGISPEASPQQLVDINLEDFEDHELLKPVRSKHCNGPRRRSPSSCRN